MLSPPIGTVRSGLRAWSVKRAGASATRLANSSRGILTRCPSTAAPASRHMRAASSSRKSMPISSRMRIEASWIISTPSAFSTS